MKKQITAREALMAAIPSGFAIVTYTDAAKQEHQKLHVAEPGTFLPTPPGFKKMPNLLAWCEVDKPFQHGCTESVWIFVLQRKSGRYQIVVS